MQFGWQLQREVQRLLTGAVTHPALVNGREAQVATPIYDGPPANAPKPYIVLGIATAIEDNTATFTGAEHTLTIHVWTDNKYVLGSMVVKSLLSQIHTALDNADITIPDARVVAPREDSSRVIPQEGGETHQGIFVLRCAIYNTADR